MLERIKFRVAHVSSEDFGYVGTELEKHGPTVDGWRSAKSSVQPSLPHELILQLETRARLSHVQLLTHQYLIPEKIELHIGEIIDENTPTASNTVLDREKMQFILLGHVSLSTNLNTGFKVRELKSISLQCSGTLVKVRVYPNYINKYNRFNQVSLVALNLLGEKLDDEIGNGYGPPSLGLGNPIIFHETTANERDKHLFSPYDDLSFTMYVDNDIQDLVRKLDQKKQEAILDERFDFASKLKATMEHLRKSGEVLVKYQLEKKIAAAREDFQKAKEKKIQADSYREHIYKSFRINQLLEPNGRLAQNDEPGRVTTADVMSQSFTGMTLTGANTMSTVSTPESTASEMYSLGAMSLAAQSLPVDVTDRKESGYFSGRSGTPEVLDRKYTPEPKFGTPEMIRRMAEAKRIDVVQAKRTPEVVRRIEPRKSSLPEVEERVDARQIPELERVARIEPTYPPLYLNASPNLSRKRRTLERMEKELREERAVSAHSSISRIPRPSNMSERAKRYAALPISVFGDQLVEKMFSKNFAVKEDGLRNLQKALSDYKRGDKNNPPSKIFRAANILLQRTIKDIVFSVFHGTVQTIQYLLDDWTRKHRLPASELSQGLERMIPELISKTGDSTLGKNKVASECLLKLQSCHHIEALHIIPVSLTKPFDTPAHHRLAQSKAEMVEELLARYGVSNDKNSGMTARDFVEFSVSAFNQPSESVRRVAERLLVTLYQKHARLLRQHLPLEEDVSPKNIQYRHLFQQFDKIDRERKHGDPHFLSMSGIAGIKDSRSSNSLMTSSIYIPNLNN